MGGDVMEDVMVDGVGLNEADAPEREVVGLYGLPDAELAKRIRTWLREAHGAKKSALLERKTDHEMHGGKQWSDTERDYAKVLKKPILTLNMLLGIINAIVGEERDNRKEIKFFGNEETDDGPAYNLNRLVKWVMKACGGEFELSKAFQNAAIAGQDWLGLEVDYFEDPEGKLKICQVDDEEIFEDPLDTTEALTKSRFLLRVKMWPEDEIEAKWPGKLDLLRMEHFDHEPGQVSDGSGYKDIYDAPSDTASVKLCDGKEKRWAIIECWWSQVEPGFVVVNEATGLLDEMTPEEFETAQAAREAERAAVMQQRLDMVTGVTAPAAVQTPLGAVPAPLPEVPAPLQAIERPIRRLYQAFQCVDTILERNASPIPRLKRFPYVPVRAMYNKADKSYFGFVRPARDMQLQGNIEQSVIVQMMQLMPKSSWMGPRGAFHNKTDWQNKLAQPGAMLEYDARKGKPEPITPPAMPRHLLDMAMQRPVMMREITGVNYEMSGSRSGSDTGVVIDKRQKAGRTMLTPFFDNYRQTKIELGKVLLAFIQHFVTPGRQIRAIGDNGKTELVPMTDEMQLGRFDITVDEGDESVNDRFEALYVLQTTLPQMVKAGVPVTPEFIDLLPLPPHIRKAWRRQIAWEMTIANRLPPPDWQEGQPIPMAPPMLPPGGVPLPDAPPPA